MTTVLVTKIVFALLSGLLGERAEKYTGILKFILRFFSPKETDADALQKKLDASAELTDAQRTMLSPEQQAVLDHK
jgi:hypothetical protein